MKLSRRKILKLLGLSNAALLFAPCIGCEKYLEGFINCHVDLKKEDEAYNLVKQFCEANFKDHNYLRSLLKLGEDFEPARDFIAVANHYRILSMQIVGNKVIVNVQYEYVGVLKGNDFYFNRDITDNKIIAKYIVYNGTIINSAVFVQTDLFKDFLRQSIIFNNESIVRYTGNSFMKNEFIRRNSKFISYLLRLT